MGRKRKERQQDPQQQIPASGNATVTRVRDVWLPVTDEQLSQDSHELAVTTNKVNRILADRKAANTTFNEELKILREREKRLALIVESKTAPEKLEVDEFYDYDHCQLTVTRRDTGAQVEQRTLTADEMLAGSPDGEGPADNGSAPLPEPPFETDAQRQAFADLDEQQAARAALEGRPADVPAPPAD